ncbi:serine/threonine-protein kinase 36 isoform X2 [Xyrichtys novacula]|uniref:non-specific serine/threonine protein kinase n=1 Tax=Xyrichtys novacula TaxID=13765 RepID=A0AAV1FUA0_XYRNO|nr:serine/threonine-protein kinase 36 isoform X2 [Xyrichtys novacula]
MNSYNVLEMVGEGSFGRVYKGRKRHTGQVVAMKFMPKTGRSEKELRSLKREIEIMRNLQHPNIVQMYDSFETETEVVVVTEYAEGQLFQILEDDGHLPESQVREIACQLVLALHYLHSHRILHRDMKPQNILLGKSGVVKLCDFGFARAMSVSTLVLTSIKGTPLYMSPELVEEKPYDHTADLWSLGCILYELHTGAPPFHANSIFHLVQLIVKDPVKWPDSMSPTCTNFLKGLLTKDPQKRLSWPDLLHDPFVSDGVQVLSDSTVFSPLTVKPSPDMLALKLKQVAEKTVPIYGESKLIHKVQEQIKAGNRGRSAGSDSAKKKKGLVENERINSRVKPPSCDVSATLSYSVKTEAKQRLDAENQTGMGFKSRGRISRDYEQEFPSVEVGPRLIRRCSEDVDTEEYWQKLVQESDPNRQQQAPLNLSAIIPQLQSKIGALTAQLTSGEVEEVWQIQLPLRVLHNLILTSDLEESYHIGCKLDLPYVLFNVIHDTVENLNVNKQPWSVAALEEMIVILIIYWENHCDWVDAEQRLEEFTKSFITILSQPNLIHLAPLAACVLSLFVQYNIDVQVHMDSLTSLLKKLLLDSYESRFTVPSGWGCCDGLLSLLLHTLSKENMSGSVGLDPVLFLDLWKRIGTSLARTVTDTDFCSANGLYSFLSTALTVFTKDPYSCVPLFSDCQSKCVFTLGRLLGTDCPHLFAGGSPGRHEADLSHDCLSVLSCHLLCFPFALDLPSSTMSTIIQLYDSCGIVTSLLQVIQTLPPPLLELPLSLLSRLLLCDPERSVSRLKEDACGFFMSSGNGQVKSRAPLNRTACSLLSDLLQLEELRESAVELLHLLSRVARFSSLHTCFELHLKASVLHRALAHTYDPIRAATCRLLGNLDPFEPLTMQTLKPDVFKRIAKSLQDSCSSVRRMACRAVGNWLGYIAAKEEFIRGRSSGKDRDTTGWGEKERQNKHTCSHSKTVGDLASGTGVAIAVSDADEEEMSRWLEEARRTAAILVPLLSDPDALTRRHCCAALGNLLHVEGTVSLLLEEKVTNLLLKAACSDPNNTVRQAAIATLSLYSQQDATHQVLVDVNASRKLRLASQHASSSSQCDYEQLIAQLSQSLVQRE